MCNHGWDDWEDPLYWLGHFPYLNAIESAWYFNYTSRHAASGGTNNS